MTKLTKNVFTQQPIASDMVICRNAAASMSVDVRVGSVSVEIDNGEDRCVSFDMSMPDARAFFAAVCDAIPHDGQHL